ncbi:hypothetical protein QA612_20400 [Evansella sp. AB-P1]|uniref:hypothetical protein n=1 Tax=Evansella sp. AB-P1 TaxID=3037653 RepID=UPI00241C4204|nr:hypothetical protein [Evansella sp. AB-P1]MDG5789821.1 hypothetical protein [Evansella sp. AB-P1]
MLYMAFFYVYIEAIKIIVPGIIAFIAGIVIASRGNRKKNAKARFYSVYFPIFKLIEPHLYKRITHDDALKIINEVNQLIDEHYELFDPSCLYAFKYFRNDLLTKGTINENYYDSFCRLIERDYDSLVKVLNLPRRTLFYKIYTNHYRKKPKIIVDEALQKITVGFFVLSGLLFLIIISKLIIDFIEQVSILFYNNI